LTPPLVDTAVFLAALLASYLRGALAPVFFLAVYLVRAIVWLLVNFFYFLKNDYNLVEKMALYSAKIGVRTDLVTQIQIIDQF
jgi:hypothetical protein